ncbi:YrhB domain-containing protein [Chitinophaga sp. Hz27]|uniref:YrhB domain-containing protein n=1 Tax=Chitinophaga sp. Hz27 TaxID=3347169 RepID=UPI0035DF40D6
MLSLVDAKEVAITYLEKASERSKIDLRLLEDETIEFEIGWMFFYQSEEFIESGDIMKMLVGNSPIIIDKRNGDLSIPGTAYPSEFYIEKYVKDFSTF